MDSLMGLMQEGHRIGLLRKFYSSMNNTTMKLECRGYGFDLLETMKENCKIDYCEQKRTITKVKISDLHEGMFPGLLRGHIKGIWNICGYWNEKESQICALNFDDDTEEKPNELAAVVATASLMVEKVFGIPVMVVCSGKGYHLWIRTAELVDNFLLRDFLLRLKERVFERLEADGVDLEGIKAYAYPMRDVKINSLRLFGSTQIRTEEFCSIAASDSEYLLSEKESWDYLEKYLRDCKTTETQILTAWGYLREYPLILKAGA